MRDSIKNFMASLIKNGNSIVVVDSKGDREWEDCFTSICVNNSKKTLLLMNLITKRKTVDKSVFILDLVSELEVEERGNIVFSALLKLQQRADVHVKKDSSSPYAQQLFNEHNVAICYFN